jgi:microcystin-dependent protein
VGLFLFYFCTGEVCLLSYPSDALSDNITALVATAPTLSSASSAVATITAGQDVLVSNFAGVSSVLSKFSTLLSELQTGHYYCPVGMIAPFAGTSAYVPSGWIMCYGQAYNASGAGIGPASADLQAVLNAANFSAVPDLRGRVIAGIDNMGGTDAARLSLANTPGTAGGAETLPAHDHPISGSGTTSGSDWNAAYNHYSPGSGSAAYPVSTSEAGGRTIQGAGGNHTHTYSFSGTSGSTGTGTHGVVQPTIVLNYIIKN